MHILAQTGELCVRVFPVFRTDAFVRLSFSTEGPKLIDHYVVAVASAAAFRRVCHTRPLGHPGDDRQSQNSCSHSLPQSLSMS